MPSATLTIIGQLSLTPSRRVLGIGTAGATADNNNDNVELQMTLTFLYGRVLQQTIEFKVENDLERRALQSSSSNGQLLRASYQLSIVDPSTNSQQTSSTNTANSQNSSGSSTETIVIIVALTAGGIALGIIIAYLAYHKLSKKGREINKDMEYAKQVGAEQHNKRADLYKDDEEEAAACKNEKKNTDGVPKDNL
jgi:hypothetical protein